MNSDKYEDLVHFFKEWREFQKPRLDNGVPDYTEIAMAEQKRSIPKFKKDLSAIDCRGWPITQQVDYEIIWAEINGLEFDHRILKPWSRNPLFYAVIQTGMPDVPARECCEIYGVLNVFEFSFPLNEGDTTIFKEKLGAIPDILLQAKQNLVEEAGDLWPPAIQRKKKESTDLVNLATGFKESNPDLADLALKAKVAVDDFAIWLEQKSRGMKAFSGIGIAEYDRYMKEVHLVPYSWREQLILIERELERSLAALTLEEHRNRRLPPLKVAASLSEIQDRKKKAVTEFLNYLKNEEIFTVDDYMHLEDEVKSFIPLEQLDLFTHVLYRHSLPMQCHSVHWLDKQRDKRYTHPIRGDVLLYKIWANRAEGFATAFEELMVQLGFFENHPRARELVYIILAYRAIRAIAELKLHSGDFTLEEAVTYAVEKTPRGYLKPNSDLIKREYASYLSVPGYGASYVIGKLQLDKLVADRADQLGDQFRIKDFFDDYFVRGLIPVSLIRWEMTALDDEMRKLRE